MIKDIAFLADGFRKLYKCNTQEGVVENMLLAIAGRTPEQCVEPLTQEEIRKITHWLKNPPFKARVLFQNYIKAYVGWGLATGAVIGFYAWLES